MRWLCADLFEDFNLKQNVYSLYDQERSKVDRLTRAVKALKLKVESCWCATGALVVPGAMEQSY